MEQTLSSRMGGYDWVDTLKMRTVHLIFTPIDRLCLFTSKEKALFMVRTLGEAAKKHDIVLHEACIMPDHVHVLVSFERGRHLEKDIVKKLKGASARYFLKEFNPRLEHLWGKKKHFEEIESKEQFMSAVEYIQRNPTKDSIDADGRLLSTLRMYYAQSNDKGQEE